MTNEISSESRAVAVAFVVALFVSPSFAQDAIFELSWNQGRAFAREVRESDVEPQTLVMSYDNFTAFNPPFENGRTILNNDRRIDGAEVGDDVNLTVFSDRIIDGGAFSLVNFSTGRFNTLRAAFRWYDRDTNALLGGYILDGTFGRFIEPGERIRVRDSVGFLRGFNIPVSERMWYTTQFLEATAGVDVADLGVQYGGPHNVGTSSSIIRNFTTGQNIDLGGPNQNLGHFVRTWPIPAPSITSMLMLAGLSIAHRRRRS